MSELQPLIINDWKIYTHPLFLNQLEKLAVTVEKLQQKYLKSYQEKNPQNY